MNTTWTQSFLWLADEPKLSGGYGFCVTSSSHHGITQLKKQPFALAGAAGEPPSLQDSKAMSMEKVSDGTSTGCAGTCLCPSSYTCLTWCIYSSKDTLLRTGGAPHPTVNNDLPGNHPSTSQRHCIISALF